MISIFHVQAGDLLRHPHLRPYVLNVHLKSNNPRRHTFPALSSDTNLVKKTRFLEAEAVKTEKRLSFGNNRALNPSISGNELDTPYSSRRAQKSLSHLNDKLAELSIGSVGDDIGVQKLVTTKFSTVKTPRMTSAKASANLRRQSTPSKISNPGSTRELVCSNSVVSYFIFRNTALRKFNPLIVISLIDSVVLHACQLPVSHTPVRKPSQSTRRASLPLSTRAVTTGSPYKPSIGLLGSVESPDVSVNAPRIDKMVDFPLASTDDPLLPSRRTSLTSAPYSYTPPYSVDRSITKDKCTIQILDRTFARPHSAHGVQYNGSECSEHNPTSGGGSTRSSSDSRQRRFDTSSYQQRAEALEGLLEFSAQLLQQERFDELQVLLKPFGPEKVSPRETAIWLTKSFKEKQISS